MTSTDSFERRPAMGSLAWGAGATGRMTRVEAVGLVGNLMQAQAREAVDAARSALGLLRPCETAIEALAPPQTALVQDALTLAEETHEAALLHHSWRTYLFGVLFAQHERITYDRSLLFAAAILHDLGLTRGHEPSLCKRCFALSGGERAQRYLDACGHPPEVGRKVGDAIALHLNGWVSRRLHGAEAQLVSRGAFCDLFGVGRRRVAASTLKAVLAAHPRAQVTEALQFETAQHHRGTRPAVMTAMSGRKAPRDPFIDLTT